VNGRLSNLNDPVLNVLRYVCNIPCTVQIITDVVIDSGTFWTVAPSGQWHCMFRSAFRISVHSGCLWCGWTQCCQ